LSDLFPDATTLDVGRDDKIKALERELRFRRRVYARRVEIKKMSQWEADRQILIFEAILQDYRDGQIR